MSNTETNQHFCMKEEQPMKDSLTSVLVTLRLSCDPQFSTTIPEMEIWLFFRDYFKIERTLSNTVESTVVKNHQTTCKPCHFF